MRNISGTKSLTYKLYNTSNDTNKHLVKAMASNSKSPTQNPNLFL